MSSVDGWVGMSSESVWVEMWSVTMLGRVENVGECI